jgi:hypothetical protein
MNSGMGLSGSHVSSGSAIKLACQSVFPDLQMIA